MATLFVSPFGDGTKPGTLDAPFRTIEKGLERLTAPGDVLYLRGGSCAEDVTIVGKHGELGVPIVIRAYGREHASIDGAEPVYGKASNWLSGMEKGFMLLKRPVSDDVEPDEWCVTFLG